ncbi:hypothetical protein GALL_543000 [mine drainage metagenome]|uniref:Uncharacterized protein n=1 Tax=mine drainage metagenome TaxID=410659 RepID=A0A1J5NZA3_9ZZZZ
MQPQSRGAGCILRPGAEAIPAPQIAVEADEALAGFQRGLQGSTLVAFNKADLPDAALQDVRHADMGCQRFDTLRQRVVGVVFGQGDPTGARLCGNHRRAKIIGKRRAECLFVAGFNHHAVEELGACMRLAVDQFRQGSNFGAQRIRFALSFRALRARLRLTPLRLGAGGFRLGQQRLRLFGVGHRGRKRLLRRVVVFGRFR